MIPATMKPQAAYELWLEQQSYMEIKAFKGRLYRLRQQTKKYLQFAAADNAAFDHDEQYWAENRKEQLGGKPHWDGSDAQHLLRQDVALVQQMSPPPPDEGRLRMRFLKDIQMEMPVCRKAG